MSAERGVASAGCEMKNKYLWAGSIIGVILVLDQFTKHLVQKHIRLYEVVPVIQGFFNLTHVRNRGAAFSILSNLPDAWRVSFFITVTVIAVGVMAMMIKNSNLRFQVVTFSLIIGGAVGNAIDRIRFTEVVDFIQIYIWEKFAFLHPWPSFNVADSAISIGVALLAIEMLFLNKKESDLQAPNTK